MRTGPIRTRTSRSTGAPTAPNIRRSWRFQPCASVARYQFSSGGVGRRSATSRSTSRVGHRAEAGQLGEAFVQLDARAKAGHLVGQQRGPQAERVLALDTEARVQDPLRPRSVVGEQEQPLRILVEAANRIEPSAFGDEGGRQEVEHGAVRMPVAGGRGDARRLVQEEIGLGGRATDEPAVHGDDGTLRIDLRPQPGDLAVDGDAPLGDERLARSSGGDAGGGQDLLEPLGGHQSDVVGRWRGRPSSSKSGIV